jgi:hypothetical protein
VVFQGIFQGLVPQKNLGRRAQKQFTDSTDRPQKDLCGFDARNKALESIEFSTAASKKFLNGVSLPPTGTIPGGGEMMMQDDLTQVGANRVGNASGRLPAPQRTGFGGSWA